MTTCIPLYQSVYVDMESRLLAGVAHLVWRRSTSSYQSRNFDRGWVLLVYVVTPIPFFWCAYFDLGQMLWHVW